MYLPTRFVFPISLRVAPTLLLQISLPEGNNAVPPRLLNADQLAQIIGTEFITDVIIDDAEACTLLDSRATVDLMSSSYAKARSSDVRPIMELNDHFVNLKLATGFCTSASGYVEYNLQIQGISSYDLDGVALVADDDTQFGKEVPLTIGTKTEDTICEAMKEGEIGMLDNIWKRVKNNGSLTKLREEVGFREAMVKVPKAAGEEHPEFEDPAPYSNKEMEDLELNELASTVRTEIIPPQSNKTIRA